MTAAAWVMMITTMVVVSSLTAYFFLKVLRSPRSVDERIE